MDNGGEWEMSKENIQPLRQGRKFYSLRKALTPRKGCDSEVERQRQIFETKLRTYDGDDPIEVWLQYIEWVEQNYPTGSREGNVLHLLEYCIQSFRENLKYQDDIRFLNICMKYASLSSNSLEIFNFIYNQNIGCSHADLYTTWAWTLEQLGDFQRANSVLNMGIERSAKPLQALHDAQRKLQIKFVKSCSENEDITPAMLATEGDHRTALVALNPKGRKQQAPVSRTGAAKLDVKVRLPSSSGNCKQAAKSNARAFQIFSDDNARKEPCLAMNVTEQAAIPTRKKSKENERVPGKWSKAKYVPKRNAPASQAATRIEEFPVHEDENSSMAKSATMLPKSSNVLSIRKSEWHVPVAVFEPPDRSKCPMYCKMKVYGGNTEFSFEEISAAKWTEQQRKLAEEEAKRAMQEEMQHKLQQLEVMLSKLNYASKPQHEQLAGSGHNFAPDVSGNVREASLSCSTVSRSLAEQFAVAQDWSRAGAARLPEKRQPNVTYSSDNMVAAVFTHSLPASPTLHTREAFREVGALWEGTILHTSSVDNMNNISQELYAKARKAEPSFSVFCDPSQTIPLLKYQPGSTSQSCPQKVHEEACETSENKENIPAAGYTQAKEERVVTGILQPSVGIPCGPPEELEEAVDDHDDDAEVHMLEGIRPLDDDECKDFTLCNTANFFKHASVVCSTPFIHNEEKKPALIEWDCDGSAKHATIAPLVSEKVGAKLLPSGEGECQDKNENATINFKGNFVPHNLSVIVETSRENTKSSSSSSSNSTVPSISNSTGGKSLRDSTGRTSKLALSSCNGRSYAVTGEWNKDNLIDLDYEDEQEVRMTAAPRSHADSRSVADPFDSSEKHRFLRSLVPPLCDREGYLAVLGNFPALKPLTPLEIGEKYLINYVLGQGGTGKVFHASIVNNSGERQHTGRGESAKDSVALKVIKPADPWEFYISSELHARLAKLGEPSVETSIAKVRRCFEYNQGCILMEEFCPYGSLLDLVNSYKSRNLKVPECVTLYFALELMLVVSQMHRCGIIHADLKPDNVLIKKLPHFPPHENVFPLEETFCICLVDFGLSIDMCQHLPGTVFDRVVKTPGFQCPEMKEGRPWTYQMDLFGILEIVHILLFGEYMKITKNADGRWEITSKLRRYWLTRLWHPLFDILLNIPDCDRIPDLAPFIHEIQQYFLSKSNYVMLVNNCAELQELL